MNERTRTYSDRFVGEDSSEPAGGPVDGAIEQALERNRNMGSVLDRALSRDSQRYLRSIRQRGGQ